MRIKQHVKGESLLELVKVKSKGKKLRNLFKRVERMFLEGNILKLKHREDVSNIDRDLCVIPDHLAERVIHDFHKRGHFGVRKLSLTMLQHVYLYEMTRKIRKVVMDCESCQAQKGPARSNHLEMISQSSGMFNEKLIIDLIAFKPSSSVNTRVLSIVDLFSGYGMCLPMKGGTAKEVANKLVNGWIANHSMMHELQSERGGEFTADLMRELCKILEVKKIQAAPWSPWSSGCRCTNCSSISRSGSLAK